MGALFAGLLYFLAAIILIIWYIISKIKSSVDDKIEMNNLNYKYKTGKRKLLLHYFYDNDNKVISNVYDIYFHKDYEFMNYYNDIKELETDLNELCLKDEVDININDDGALVYKSNIRN